MNGVNQATSESKERHDHETVGAVALDSHGNVACATSTGGITTKRPGRVGDSPIVGKLSEESVLSCPNLSCIVLSCFCTVFLVLSCPVLRDLALPVLCFV